VAVARRRRAVDRGPVEVRIEQRRLSQITPYENNPRQNAEAVQSVANSIRQFGFIVPIVVNAEGVIAAGHTRYEAARHLGMEQVPVVVADHLTPQQLDAFRLIDNKVSELAKWDLDMLSAEITALQNSGIEFTNYGWTQEEIDCLTEIVADDCLSAGVATQLDQRRHDDIDTRRAPARTRFVLGDIVFFVDQSAAREWLSDIRAEVDFEETALINLIKDRLGIDQYEEQ
jgi:hypothetical protein